MGDGDISPKSTGPREWLWRGQAIRAARSFRTGLPEKSRKRLLFAQRAAELAERALDPIDPLRSGSSVALALSLYREAAYWALLVQSENLEATDLKAAFSAASPELLSFAAGGSDELERIEQSLVQDDFIRVADLGSDELLLRARSAKAFVEALLQQRLAPEAELGRLYLQRWTRLLGILGIFVVIAIGGALLYRHFTHTPDLASGKKWRTSSSTPECDPIERTCNGAPTKMLFHTREEDHPWFEIDLGSPTTFSRVDVENRSDCCADRAIPLIVQVSSDRHTWKEVARRTDSFATWHAKFEAQTARYVRLEAQRRTFLHLDSVEVRP